MNGTSSAIANSGNRFARHLDDRAELVLAMAADDKAGLGDALHRKLRGVKALLHDPATTEHERSSAAAAKKRLEKLLTQRGIPNGDWTDVAFRWGRAINKATKATAPPHPKQDWTDVAFRFARTIRQTMKKGRSS